jgi:hypothetical protein
MEQGMKAVDRGYQRCKVKQYQRVVECMEQE